MKRISSLFAACGVLPTLATAHALPERAVPSPNATLYAAPADVSIYFDAELEPLFSKLTITRDTGEKVSPGDGLVDPGNHKVLTTPFATGAKGTYHVHWNVISRDGHRAKGEYAFSVK